MLQTSQRLSRAYQAGNFVVDPYLLLDPDLGKYWIWILKINGSGSWKIFDPDPGKLF